MGTSQQVRNGDLVFCLFDVPETPRTVGLSSYDGMITGAYTVFESLPSHDAVYFELFYRAMDDRKLLSPLYSGLRNTIPAERFLATKTPQPPLEERSAIVRFIQNVDHSTSRLIRAKRRVIELLNEQKQAIIQRAVTRGLGGDARLTPSNTAWLGDVPETWKIMPLKRAFAAIDYGISEPGTEEGMIPVLGMPNIQDGRVTAAQPGGVHTVHPKLLLKPGDLLFNRTNSAELVGKVGLFLGSDKPTTFASYLVRLRTTEDVGPEYLNYYLNSRVILRRARQLAIPSLHQSNLNPNRYGRITVALPPLQEQRRIVSHLQSELRGLESSTQNVLRELALLGEYRTRLIADVVTGKLDVRNVQLPEARLGLDAELERQELLDEDLQEETAHDEEPVEAGDLEG